MNNDKLGKRVLLKSPRIIYLSGKTCTGKTTFANYLEQHGYQKIGLDKIVTESVVIPFNVPPGDGFRTAYRDDGPKEQADAFISAARVEITQKLKTSSLVIEGAIARSRILKDIFTDELSDFVFIYFHPVHTNVYVERILSRFVAGARTNTTGLPKDFWVVMQEDDLNAFKETGEVNEGIQKAIATYAAKSMEESKARLAHLQESFSDIAVVEI